MKVVVINGYAESGKDTFVDLCYDLYKYTLNVSLADKAKLVAKYCGWEGKKDEKSRKFLSDIKDLIDEYNDASFTYVERKINCFCQDLKNYHIEDEPLIFIHSRQPEDIQRLKDRYNAKTLFIKRDSNTRYTNHADANVENFNYDYYIDNNGTLEDLKDNAARFIHELI